MDNPLKRSFDLSFKEKDEQPDPSEKVDHDTAFDQSKGAASFLNEQSNPFTEEDDGDDELPDEMKDQQFSSDDEEEEEMEEVDRGAVEDVLASLNNDYEPQSRNENQDRGAVEDVLRSLNGGGEQGKYDFHEGDDELPDEMKDQQFGDEEEEEMDEVVASVLSDLNEDQLDEDEDPCWDGYTMVGKKTDENGNEVPNCVPEEDADDYDPNESALREDWKSRIREDEAPCWDGYTMVGKKTKDGEEVPNCVPDDDVDDYEPQEDSSVEESSITEEELMEAVLQDQVQELHRLDQLAEKVLNE